MEPFLLGAVVALTIISMLAFAFGVYAVIIVKAMEKSTHSVQYVPIDPQFEKEANNQAKEINKEFKEYVEEDYSDIFPNQSF